MTFLLSFSLATSTNDDLLNPSIKTSLLYSTIILGLFHLNFEVRQFVWDPKEYVFDFWNLFDFGAYFIPVVTSVLLLCHHEKIDDQLLVSLVSASSLLLDLKFLLFLRVIKYFGIYFAIVIGVARKVFSFLVILTIIILSFAHAFHLLLKPSTPINIDVGPNFDDSINNNPWSLATRYYTYSKSTNSRVEDSFLMQPPDHNTNMFAYYKSSTLAMYNFLTGDNGAFGAWELETNPYLTILVILFSFIVVVYLMNLFIGLLSNEIDGFNKDEIFLLQKGKIVSEIELFYLLPNQRRWKHWFPDVLHYYVPIDDIREKIREYDNSKESVEFLPFISDKLRKIAEMPEPVSHDSKINYRLEKIGNSLEKNENDLKGIESNLRNDLRNDMKEIENNLKNELMTQIQILMNEIKTLKNNQ
ncbi:14442_t:CDS:2 [Entrophospora sp. SA101]|nr:14442_t:CDS:2 [Entrophospora sp. SA101]